MSHYIVYGFLIWLGCLRKRHYQATNNGKEAMKNLIIAVLLTLSFPIYVQAEAGNTSVVSTLEAPILMANINQDDAEKLATLLVGVGPVIAARIVAFRELNGPFVNLEMLLEIEGFGPKKLETNRHLLAL
jgi:competence protein ComEA